MGTLLLNGVDINLKLLDEETVLYYTVTFKKVKEVQLLLGKSTIIDTISSSEIALIITSKYLKTTAI